MKVRNYKIFGGLLFLIGIFFILNASLGITGFVVAENIRKSTGSVLGLVFVVGGLALFLEGRGRIKAFGELEHISKSGKKVSIKELLNLAKRMGYEIVRGTNHEKVYKGNNWITLVPRHKRIATGTYRGIVRDLVHAYA